MTYKKIRGLWIVNTFNKLQRFAQKVYGNLAIMQFKVKA